ncbi:MAG: hypothetical protein P8J87_17335, partial [Verrucomicrobiales bacterium]|nr:hypothetical protein [Verrucomicrobiales bacterium]
MTLRGASTLICLLASTATAAPVGEKNEVVTFDDGVRVTLNSSANTLTSAPVHLVLYALPNGNTTLQSFGYRVPTTPKPDHNIQQIGAQTRWLRNRLTSTNLVVAFLQCDGLSWPAWRRKQDPSGRQIANILHSLHARYPAESTTVTLTGHSGGGAFTFAYLDSTTQIPSFIRRIAFLDSNYGYKSEKHHGAKLATWLAKSPEHQLTVLAYQDYLALDKGKTFVSKNHGTWGRSLAMLYDLSRTTEFRL